MSVKLHKRPPTKHVILIKPLGSAFIHPHQALHPTPTNPIKPRPLLSDPGLRPTRSALEIHGRVLAARGALEIVTILAVHGLELVAATV